VEVPPLLPLLDDAIRDAAAMKAAARLALANARAASERARVGAEDARRWLTKARHSWRIVVP